MHVSIGSILSAVLLLTTRLAHGDAIGDSPASALELLSGGLPSCAVSTIYDGYMNCLELTSLCLAAMYRLCCLKQLLRFDGHPVHLCER
jgi:hypothetical protein